VRRFRKFRDDRFALTTLQNPLCEVRTRAELIQAAQLALERQPDVADIPTTPPPAATNPPPAALAPLAPSAHLIAEPPKLHTTQINVPIREPAGKRAKSRPPQKAAHHPSRNRKTHAKRAQLAEVVPSGDAARYVSEIFDRHITKSVAPHLDADPDTSTLERHSRKCAICNHPERADLEEDFVSWRNADLIQKDYDLRISAPSTLTPAPPASTNVTAKICASPPNF
jgi:hypothetical protein